MKKYADKILIVFAVIVVVCVAVETPFLVDASNEQFKKYEQLIINNKQMKEGIHIEIQKTDSVNSNSN